MSCWVSLSERSMSIPWCCVVFREFVINGRSLVRSHPHPDPLPSKGEGELGTARARRVRSPTRVGDGQSEAKQSCCWSHPHRSPLFSREEGDKCLARGALERNG